ncbi:MAG: hypothetical protein WC314_25365 [Vulcanimicrobiota bacterium]
MKSNSKDEGCGCLGCFGVLLLPAMLAAFYQMLLAIIRSIELTFTAVVGGAEAWWVSLVNTPYFHLTSVIIGSIAIGVMVGWALAFRTRLPSSGVSDSGCQESRLPEACDQQSSDAPEGMEAGHRSPKKKPPPEERECASGIP